MNYERPLNSGAATARWFWVAFALISAWKIAAAATLTLCYDETYYHYWSLHPQLSYFDHPPLTAWLMTLSGVVFGNSVWTVRLWPLLLSTASVLIARATARDLFGADAGNRAGLLLALAPVFAGNGVVMTPDAVLVLFWTLSVFCAWRALSAASDFSPWWLALGAAAGLGFLSKYTMLPFYFGLILLFIISPGERKRIFVGCLISGCVAALVFSPVLIWNVQNDFASFRFQFSRRMTQVPKSAGTSLANLAEYAGILFAIVTPFLAGLCFFSGARGIVFSAERRVKFCAALMWSVVALFAYSALKTHIQANWPMMAFVSGILLVAGVWETYPAWLRRTALGILIAADVLICSYALLPARTTLSIGSRSLDAARIREFIVTPEIAATVRRIKEEQKLDFICTSSQELFGVVQFYEPSLRDELWMPSSGAIRFPWLDGRKFSGQSALLVSERSEWGRAPNFDGVEALGSVEIPYKKMKLTLHFFRGRNYRPVNADAAE